MPILAPTALAPEVMGPEIMAPSVIGRTDALAELSDSFSYGTTLTGNGWSIEDTTPSCSPSDTITDSEADLTVAAGNTDGSFWFDTNDGALWYKAIAGACDFRARVHVMDGDGAATPPTTPPDTQFRVAGIAAHDPDRTTMEYVHVGIGSNNTAGQLQLEWKTTDNSDSAYAYTQATLTGGELLYDLRLVRRASDLQVFDLYVRAGTSRSLDDDEGWTLLQTIDRTDDQVPDRAANNGTTAVSLPSTLRWGFMVYANATVHDIRMYVAGCHFSTPTS
jgi:hypothetical protein